MQNDMLAKTNKRQRIYMATKGEKHRSTRCFK